MKKLSLILALMCCLFGCTDQTQNSPADVVYTNGDIFVGRAKNPWATSFAVDDGRIVYAGDDVSPYIGSVTEVIDLGGRLVVPGLIDPHNHPGMVALTRGQVLLDDYSSKDALLRSIERMVAENPDRDILFGGFWLNEHFDVTGPHKSELDRIESKRPVILYDDWGHTVWANSAALEQAGVTRDTQDPVPGFSFYQKDGNGEPTGWITESASSEFVNLFQSVTPDVEETILEYLQYLRSVGVTTVLDAGNFGLDREVYAAVARLDARGELPIRYHGAYSLYMPDDFEHAVAKLKRLGDEFNSDKVRIDTLKVFFDGILETRTAALSKDYLDTPGNSGEALLSRLQVKQLILALEEEGLHFHAHAVGDRATTTLLDGIQDAHDALGHAPEIRLTICHLEIVKATDFARFAELGVIANFTPHWMIGGDASWYEQGVGDESLNMMRVQPLLADGAVVTFSSDITTEFEWLADRANPFLGMQVGHNRQEIGVGADGEFRSPLSERLQREDLLLGYTSDAAYQLGREQELGSIAVGLAADFIVLDRDYFSIDRYDIHKTKPVAVFIDGELVEGGVNSGQERE